MDDSASARSDPQLPKHRPHARVTLASADELAAAVSAVTAVDPLVPAIAPGPILILGPTLA